jgi:hypothetical protein
MRVVLRANLDGSEAVRYFPVPLAIYYLRQSAVHAAAAIATTDEEPKFKESLLAVLFAALFAEAFANEMAENRLESDNLENFLWLRGKYKNKEGVSGVTWKVKLLFSLYWSVDLSPDQSPLKEIDEVFRLRNQLVHYTPTKAAGKAHMPSGEMNSVDGGVVTRFDLTKEATRFEPPVVARIDANQAVNSYNAMLRVANRWNAEADAPPDALATFHEL